MLDNFKPYHTWHARLAQLVPQNCRTRLVNMSLLIAGLYHARNVHLSAIVRKWPLAAKQPSLARRLTRFLANPAVCVRDWYRPVAEQLLAPFAGQEVRLIVDGTKVGFGHQLLMVAIAYRRRALPLAWCWVKGKKGHSGPSKQLALLSYVRGLLPPHTPVLLVGDSEFGSVGVLRQLQAWHWRFVLRQPGNTLVRPNSRGPWRRFDRLVQRPGECGWRPGSSWTAKWAYSANLLICWAATEKAPWLLTTNLSTSRLALQAYRRRMWLDETFGDLKGHGFDLEATHLQHFLRLSRLTLAVCYLYIWLITFGSRVIKAGLRPLVDRRERRDLSLFRIGWDSIERRLARGQPVHVSFQPSR